MRLSHSFQVMCCGVALALFAGCTSQDDTRTFDEKDSQASAEAEHAHEHDHEHDHGPNGGHLLEVGEEQYHVEVVFDNDKRTLTAFILGPDAKSAHPIAGETIDFDLEVGDKEHEIPLAAKPLDGEKDGKSSRFVAEGKAIPESIKAESDLNGHFHLDIGEDHFHVDLHHEGHDHDHDDHDHDHEKTEPKKEETKKEEPKKTEDKPADKE
ncbi:hypothetical protein [Gimesia panareensis]|uniref:Uncharacterized protein n=1 Tax=Gimesia panareensis TaxID=2527978 RepID=A0A517Q8X7_9PLAN|nr:hypothetical protein [Gimesia panareensis]QDT28084.1 hypothetical protein Enr10x_34230 [Gimesia panareensis]QDU50950.1 hypothetical protein Pan110_33110 [Gimesia panareensis]